MDKHFPQWLKIICQQLTKKIRFGDEIIRSKGISKKNLESIKPLSMEEQTRFFTLVNLAKYKSK